MSFGRPLASGMLNSLRPSILGGNSHFLNNYSIFTRGSGSSLVVLSMYVDDIILTGTDLIELATLKSFLHNQFRIKYLGILHYFWVLRFSTLLWVCFYIRRNSLLIC